MGVNLRDIAPRKEINYSHLKGEVVAVDAFNAIYQFLSSIRQYDGTPLMDSKGNITSHLSGLFYRNIALLSEGIKLIYVFDGEAPDLKKGLREKRKEIKAVARGKFEEAKKKEDYAEMKKYSQQLSMITKDMIETSKELLEAMGIMVVQAPGEGEAQASEMAKHKKVFAVASQDYDCLLFGAPILIQNLTLAKKRKTVTGIVEVKPEVIELQSVLNSLDINRDQLICLGILVGTDYNPKGVKGIGPKKALDFVRKFKSPVTIFEQFPESDFDWKEVFELFKKPNISQIEEFNFPKMNPDKIKEILVRCEFSEDRIQKGIERILEIKEKAKQKTLF